MEKTGILIRCTPEEADLIRKAAAVERRTLSGYIINAVMNRINMRTPLPRIPMAAEKKNNGSGRGNGIGVHARRRAKAA